MRFTATPGWGPLAGVVCGVRCVVCGGGVLVGLWRPCGVVGPSPLLAQVPMCYSPPLLAGFRCRCWWVFLATPGRGSRARFPATPGWVSLSAVVCGVWCVVCGGGVLVGFWLVCGVVGPSPLLAEVPECYSPPLLAGFRCRWWWAFLATPGCASRVLFPATPGWVSLPAVVGAPRHSWLRVPDAVPRHSWLGSAGSGGVWCAVCGVRRWCVGGVVAGVWCGWSLATPRGGSCVLLPVTPGWVSLPVVVGVPRRSWRRVPGAVPRHSWLRFAVGSGVWCVMCGGGVLVGLWLVCGVVGPSPLLAEVPVCYFPPLLARFRCRWWWAFLATPGGGSRARFPATPGLVSLSAVVGAPRHSWLRVPGAVPRLLYSQPHLFSNLPGALSTLVQTARPTHFVPGQTEDSCRAAVRVNVLTSTLHRVRRSKHLHIRCLRSPAPAVAVPCSPMPVVNNLN